MQVIVNQRTRLWADRYPAIFIEFGRWYIDIAYVTKSDASRNRWWLRLRFIKENLPNA